MDAPGFDRDLQMYRESSASVNLARLRFVRWLVEQGRLEHPPAGPPSGEWTVAPVLPVLAS